MNSPLSVTTLNNQIKSLLESTFVHVYIEGEVSRITYHNSGHLYFTLKDENSSISCVMFRGNNAKMKFRLEEGMSVLIHGSISLYVPRGSYQLNCVSIEPSGSGALAKAYEQLKKKLEALGYFSDERKKRIPKYVKSIALVTSATSAALQDMLRVANKRWPLVKIVVVDSIVQGENSGKTVAKNLKKVDALGADVIVIARGGGSIEDLWGFNEEILAHAIYEAKTPVVSAVGHEIDFVISDFVADLRAPTPSAAMEMILPEKTEMLMWIDEKITELNREFTHLLNRKKESLDTLVRGFQKHSFEMKFHNLKKEIEFIKDRYNQRLENLLDSKEREKDLLFDRIDFAYKKNLSNKEAYLETLLNALKSKDPTLGISDYFAQVVKNGKKVKLKDIDESEIFELQSKDTCIKAKAVEKEKQ